MLAAAMLRHFFGKFLGHRFNTIGFFVLAIVAQLFDEVLFHALGQRHHFFARVIPLLIGSLGLTVLMSGRHTFFIFLHALFHAIGFFVLAVLAELLNAALYAISH